MDRTHVFERKVAEVIGRFEIGHRFRATDVSNMCRGINGPSPRECASILMRMPNLRYIPGNLRLRWEKVRE